MFSGFIERDPWEGNFHFLKISKAFRQRDIDIRISKW